MENKTGIYVNVSREQYDRIDRVNFSTLIHMKRSPAHFRAVKTERAKEDTDAFMVGRATHVLALEPETFFSRYVIWDGPRRSGADWEKLKKKCEGDGLEIIREDDYQLAKAMAQAALAHERAGALLRGGSAEVTILWTDAETGIECKGRIDFAHDTGAIIDLKTTRDASQEAFEMDSWKLDYHSRAAFYVDGYAAAAQGLVLPYIVVAVEKKAPYVVQPYALPDLLIDMGRDSYRPWLNRLAQCRKESRWPGYAEGPLELRPPRWMRNDEDTTGMNLEFEQEQDHVA